MTEQIPLSCHSCKQVFNEVMEEARKYSKSNPFICHLCMKQRENPSQKIVDHDLSPHSRQNDSQTFNDVDVIATAQREAESKDHHDNKIHFHIGVPHLHHETPTEPALSSPESLPPPNTLQYYESIAKGEIKEKLDEFKARREKTERDLAEDRRRVAQNHEYGGGFSILPIAIGIVVTLIVMISIFSTVVPAITSSINCPSVNITTDSQAVQAWKTSCNTMTTQMTIVPTLIALMVVICAIVMVARILA